MQITKCQLPEAELKKKFSNIAGFFTVSSHTGQVRKHCMECLIIFTLWCTIISNMFYILYLYTGCCQFARVSDGSNFEAILYG